MGARWICVPVAPPLAVRIQLRAARRGAGLSQRALAERLGVSQQQIAALESRDSNITLSTLVEIATALDHQVAIALVPTSRGPGGAVS